MAPNPATGGLTKQGSGTLVLGGTNTYGGATTISAGTLKLGNAFALPTGTTVVLNGGVLDLSGFSVTNTVSGSGIVSNGTVVAVFSPAGEGVIGTDTPTLKNASVSGTYIADVAADGTSDLLAVQGSLDLTGLTLQIVDQEELAKQKSYTLLTCTGTCSGTFASTNLTDKRWHITLRNNTVNLVFVDGAVMLLR